MAYVVFVRNWWRLEIGMPPLRTRRLVPDPGARRTKLAVVDTYERAQAVCAEHARTHKPSKLSRKAEFTDASNY